MIISTAFLLGLLGSLHCLGMCGPLALALPGQKAPAPQLILGRVLYNSGRIVTYAILGIFSGLIGRILHMAGLQQGLSIAVGVFILVSLFIATRYSSKLAAFGPLQVPWVKLKTALGKRMKNPSLGSLFGIGLLNGLLPCGLVYVAMGAAATTGTALNGALYMAAFGLGTFPMMFAAALSAPLVTAKFRINLQRAVPMALVMLATLFILRGMSLGIPYVSPDLSNAKAPVCPGCH